MAIEEQDGIRIADALESISRRRCTVCDGGYVQRQDIVTGEWDVAECDACIGGQRPNAGDVLMLRFIEQTDRIATALEVIVGDITERRQREHESLLSQLRQLDRECERTSASFTSADNRLGRADYATTERERDSNQQWAQRCEDTMIAAQKAYDAFAAANPEIAALHDSQRRETRSASALRRGGDDGLPF